MSLSSFIPQPAPPEKNDAPFFIVVNGYDVSVQTHSGRTDKGDGVYKVESPADFEKYIHRGTLQKSDCIRLYNAYRPKKTTDQMCKISEVSKLIDDGTVSQLLYGISINQIDKLLKRRSSKKATVAKRSNTLRLTPRSPAKLRGAAKLVYQVMLGAQNRPMQLKQVFVAVGDADSTIPVATVRAAVSRLVKTGHLTKG